ncbi:MAG TPA: hypothetical protein VFQ43_19045 [Nitrososphaera sp.]|nr:hypothetical protein [Nitrososphaera sp.]
MPAESNYQFSAKAAIHWTATKECLVASPLQQSRSIIRGITSIAISDRDGITSALPAAIFSSVIVMRG